MKTRKNYWPLMFTALLMLTSLNVTTAAAQESTDLPQPNAEAVWNYIEQESYQENWPYWPGKNAFYEGSGPHGALLTTYVNPIAYNALLEDGVDEMPTGSMIIKENYSPDEKLKSLTIMYKASDAYNPEHGNWFWIKRTAAGKIAASGKVASCQACHQNSDSDYLLTPLP